MNKKDERLDLSELLKRMPKRAIKRTTVDLPEDQIKVVDACAKALGVARSTFLLLWFDSSVKAMIDWTQHLVGRSQLEVNFKVEEKPNERGQAEGLSH